jgi:hypothetical protein
MLKQKSSPKCCHFRATSSFQKVTKSSPIGEKSTNLVTLLQRKIDKAGVILNDTCDIF